MSDLEINRRSIDVPNSAKDVYKRQMSAHK